MCTLKACLCDVQKILGGNQRECGTAVVAKQVLIGLLFFLFGVNHISFWYAYKFLTWEIYNQILIFPLNMMVGQLVWLHIYELFTFFSCTESKDCVYPTFASSLCLVCLCCFSSLLFNAAINNCLGCTSAPLLMGCSKQTILDKFDSLFVNAVGEKDISKATHLLPVPPQCSLSCTK